MIHGDPLVGDGCPVRFLRADGSSFFKMLDERDVYRLSVYTLVDLPDQQVPVFREARVMGSIRLVQVHFPPTPGPSDVDPYTGMTYRERRYHAHPARRETWPRVNSGEVAVYLFAENGEQNPYFERFL